MLNFAKYKSISKINILSDALEAVKTINGEKNWSIGEKLVFVYV